MASLTNWWVLTATLVLLQTSCGFLGLGNSVVSPDSLTACEELCSQVSCGQAGGCSCSDCGTDRVCIDGACVKQGNECSDGNAVAWDGCTAGTVTEFAVAGGDSVGARLPVVSSDADSTFLIAWLQSSPRHEAESIVAQSYDSTGQATSEPGVIGHRRRPGYVRFIN